MSEQPGGIDGHLLQTAKVLASVPRLRLVGLLAGRPHTAEQLAASSGLDRQTIDRHLKRLLDAGLVSETAVGADRTWRLRPEAIAELGRGLAALEPAVVRGVEIGPDGRPVPAETARVLRAFVVDGRLTEIPAQPKKREVILDFLLEACFPEDRDYPEKEVNQRLALWHPDAASLRRYLVDSGRMTRQAGVYRRARPMQSEAPESA